MSDKLTVAAYKTNASGGTQITIERTNEEGRGWGRRLAGPKHYNMGSTTLASRELDADDAREIRAMLDAAFPVESNEPTSEQLRAAYFREAAQVLEDAGRDDDAVNLLRNIAAGIPTTSEESLR